jgi:branched-chain amino acid transport system ATP-binding protein
MITREMFRAIREINAAGVAVLLVEQNVAAALEVAHRAYVLEEGRIVAEGAPRELAAQPRIRKAYLGIEA